MVGIFQSLFGGKKSELEEVVEDPVAYKEFEIEVAPIQEEGAFRTAGYISGTLDGERKRIRFIRADQASDRQSAIDHSLAKARQIIDEQGADLLKRSHL